MVARKWKGPCARLGGVFQFVLYIPVVPQLPPVSIIELSFEVTMTWRIAYIDHNCSPEPRARQPAPPVLVRQTQCQLRKWKRA
jgi:hypothetical protein